MIKFTGLSISFALILSGCAVPELDAPAIITDSAPVDAPLFQRSMFLPSFTESTPVIYGGAPAIVSFHRDSAMTVEVRALNGSIMSTRPWNYSLGCSFVDGSRLYAFASGPGAEHTEISMTYTDDLVNWSDTQTVLERGQYDTHFWNCSVTRGPSGYVMAYEVSGKGLDGFTFRVAQSKDLIHWTPIGRKYSNTYSACPTIRYVNGRYVIMYLEQSHGGWATRAARTTDFESYERSGSIVMAAAPGEGNNASDVDLVEHNGNTYLVYLNGDQVTWGNTQLAVYSGTMSNLFESLWATQ